MTAWPASRAGRDRSRRPSGLGHRGDPLCPAGVWQRLRAHPLAMETTSGNGQDVVDPVMGSGEMVGFDDEVERAESDLHRIVAAADHEWSGQVQLVGWGREWAAWW